MDMTNSHIGKWINGYMIVTNHREYIYQLGLNSNLDITGCGDKAQNSTRITIPRTATTILLQSLG